MVFDPAEAYSDKYIQHQNNHAYWILSYNELLRTNLYRAKNKALVETRTPDLQIVTYRKRTRCKPLSLGIKHF